jgi:hypothetical protein
MLDVFRAPQFWADPLIQQALIAQCGTGDVRFGDACINTVKTFHAMFQKS